MTGGMGKNESASRALEEPAIAEEPPTDRAKANRLALMRLAKRFAGTLLR
jgi:hypothetical protein